MYDPQWLDMRYEKYYFVPWPDSQYFDNVDDDDAVVKTEGGVFVSMEWICAGDDYYGTEQD